LSVRTAANTFWDVAPYVVTNHPAPERFATSDPRGTQGIAASSAPERAVVQHLYVHQPARHHVEHGAADTGLQVYALESRVISAQRSRRGIERRTPVLPAAAPVDHFGRQHLLGEDELALRTQQGRQRLGERGRDVGEAHGHEGRSLSVICVERPRPLRAR
jgi:hypothetical protein